MPKTNDLNRILDELLLQPDETEWIEFKKDNQDPQVIGKNISALANSAALYQKPRAYMVWGVEDRTHRFTGTDFQPRKKKISKQELEHWLNQRLKPHVHFQIHEFVRDCLNCVIFEIHPATHSPVSFINLRYIRVGSYTQPLSNVPDKERILWQVLSNESFESGIAQSGLNPSEIPKLLMWEYYFRLTKQRLPQTLDEVLKTFCAERLIEQDGGRFNIKNLGALLFARNLGDFPTLYRKGMRVITYEQDDRLAAIKDQQGQRGYAIAFPRIVQFIMSQIPQREQFIGGIRKTIELYPEEAVRELAANALIHQDFLATGMEPKVEIFPSRVEVVNPGTPLVEIDRFIDVTPCSRNDKLATFMRRLEMCEERGSGIDRVVGAVEQRQLPPPDFRAVGATTRVTLFAPRKFSDMTKEDRVRACYQHACLLLQSDIKMTNKSLRSRFRGADQSAVSRIISETIDTGMIKKADPNSNSKRYVKYVPYWA
ncbi:MAG: ATP-binding protein [Acidobacteriota bacterium]